MKGVTPQPLLRLPFRLEVDRGQVRDEIERELGLSGTGSGHRVVIIAAGGSSGGKGRGA
jgi:hypothetical protein